MDKPTYKLVGSPCGQHGQYTFYKALRVSTPNDRIIAIGDFFFVKIWQDSELESIGELQLLWTDRVSDQTLVSLRLYFLPENTPDGRNQHGQDEVLAISDKVVLKCSDLLSWLSSGSGWQCGLRAVYRGACAPSNDPTQPLHRARLDIGDIDKEKSELPEDPEAAGVVVFSYPRYCRYRAVLARLAGVRAAWLRDALVAALGGYSAPTKNTAILFCRDTFEYPELESHEFICNHLAPRLKGRPRGRRRRARSRSRSPSSRSRSRSSGSDTTSQDHRDEPKTPRRLSLRNGATERQSSGEDDGTESHEDRQFLQQLKQFHYKRGETNTTLHTLKDLSLRWLYGAVTARGGYAAACGARAWRALHPARPARARAIYERYLLPFENHERKTGKLPPKPNGKIEDKFDTIDVPDSPTIIPENLKLEEKDSEMNITSKPAEELNREFLESLPKEEKPKITVKPVEKLMSDNVKKLFEENNALITELSKKYNADSSKVMEEIGKKELSGGSEMFLSELAQRLNLGATDPTLLKELAFAQNEVSKSTLSGLTGLADKYGVNGHTQTQPDPKRPPLSRSSLRAVRVKPTRAPVTPPQPPQRPEPPSSTPPGAAVTNFGIHRPPPSVSASASAPPSVRASQRDSDDEIVEVPYKPKSPEIIDLDEYPESPQAAKKKKLDILKERGLEVTAIPPAWGPGIPPPLPLINPPPLMLNPAMQHQIMTQASLFQMYNIIPQNYANGIHPPKVIQSSCLYGSAGPEKTVYGNPKDPFMPPPHILHGIPIKPQKVVTAQKEGVTRQDILDLTCKTSAAPSNKPAVEIVRVPSVPSPSKAQNLSKNYTLLDGKAVVGSNLEITLVSPKSTSPKHKPVQKRSSNGKFVSTKTPTPPKDYPKLGNFPPSPSSKNISPTIKKPLNIPNYQIREDSPSSTSSRESNNQSINPSSLINPSLMNAFKPQAVGPNIPQMVDQKSPNLTQLLDAQKALPSPFVDPLYMNALYSSLANMDQRQLAMYRDFMATQFRGYSGLLGGVTPTTKN